MTGNVNDNLCKNLGRLWQAERESAVIPLVYSERQGCGRRRTTIGPVHSRARAWNFARRGNEPGLEVRRIFNLISVPGQSVPTQVEGILGGLRQNIEGDKGQRDKAGSLQSSLRFLILHEKLPRPLSAVVFDHDDDRTFIDSEFIKAVPLSAEIESVLEAVGSPDMQSKIVHGFQCGHTDLRGESHGAARSGWRDRAVIALRRWRTMSAIAVGIVARRQSPNRAAIADLHQWVGNAIVALGQGSAPRVLEIGRVVAVHVGVGDMAEINPAVRVLMSE